MTLFIWIIISITVTLIAKQPKVGLYLMAVFLPIIGWNLYLGALEIPFIDLIALMTLFAWILNYIANKLSKPNTKLSLTWPLIFPFGIFFIASILSNIYSSHPLDNFYYFLRWPVFLYFAYIFVPANIIKDVKTLKTTVIMLFIGTLLVLLSGYLSLFEQETQNTFFRLRSSSLFGLYPFGDNHNLIAEFLNVGAFFILIIKEFVVKPSSRRLMNVLFIITILAIMLTFSRAAWITLLLQLMVYFFARLKTEPRSQKKLIVAIILLIISLSPLVVKMNLLQDNNYGSTASRLLLSEIAVSAWKQKPLLGHGSGQFINLVEDNIRFRANHGEPMDSHGLIQKVAAENGLIGLIAWIGILIYLGRFGFLAVKKYYPKVKWILPFSLAAFGGLFFQFFNTSYYKGRVWLPLLLFIIAVEMSEKKQQQYVRGKKNLTDNPQS